VLRRSGRPPAPPWDAGLQPERTALAWQRTVLSLLVGEIALARWTAGTSRGLAAALLALPLPGALYLQAVLVGWHRRQLTALRAAQPLRDRARAVPVLTVVVAVTGAVELLRPLVA